MKTRQRDTTNEVRDGEGNVQDLIEELFGPSDGDTRSANLRVLEGHEGDQAVPSGMLDFYAEHFADDEVPDWSAARAAGEGERTLTVEVQGTHG